MHIPPSLNWFYVALSVMGKIACYHYICIIIDSKMKLKRII